MSRIEKIQRRRTPLPSSSGFTLIELLVAVVVLSLGLLATANLQLISTRGNFEAMQRTQATTLANDAIDRMRANSQRLDLYATGEADIVGTATTQKPAACTATMEPDVCLIAVANLDRWELEQSLSRTDSLIDPRICVAHDALNPGNVTVVVAWRGAFERTDGGAGVENCGKATIDNAFLKQIAMSTFITPVNPY